jgi:hypothetical protein
MAAFVNERRLRDTPADQPAIHIGEERSPGTKESEP